MARKYFIMYVLLIAVIAGCSGMSSLQTARTMKKGQFGGSLAVGFAQGEDEDEGEENDLNFQIIPNVEINARYGLCERWDVGIELGMPSLVSIDTKYQILGNDSSFFAGSIGS